MKAVDFKKLESAPLDSIGYSAASQGDTLEVLAAELLRRNPSGEFSDESKAELEKGMTGRKNELYGTRYFAHKGSEYLPIDKEAARGMESTGVFALTIEFACGLSAYDFGQLKTKDAARYELVKGARYAESQYRSNRMKSLMKAVNDLKAGIKGRTRGANKVYLDWISDKKKGLVQTMLTRAATARKNGDPTAPKDKAELKKMICEQIDKA
jgi:hypothetical protein